MCNSFISSCFDIEKTNILNKQILPNLDNFDKNSLEFFKSSTKTIFSSLINMGTKFENIKTKILNLDGINYYYNLIQVELIETLFHKENNQIFYVIKLNDRHSLIIAEMDKNTYKDSTSLCSYFNSIYSVLERGTENKSNKILLPSFKVNYTEKYIDPYVLPTVSLRKYDENFNVHKLLEHIDISFDYDLNYENDFIENRFDENAITIKNNFIIGLLNLDLLTEFSLPISFIYHIEKNSWQKK